MSDYQNQVERLKDKSRNDSYYFIKNVLNYNKLHPNPHRDLLNFIEKSKKRTKLILMPRGSYKSSVVTVGKTLHKITKNPNLRVLIASETQRNAIRFAKEIKTHFEENVKFRTIFGDWVNKNNTWKEGEFIVSTRNQVKKEPTIMASSLEKGTIVGLHFDYIILDDVVSRNNINSPEQVEKTIEYYKLLLSILEPDGEIIVIGTRWGFYELYSWLLDPDGPEFDNVDSFVRQAQDDSGKLLMPEVLTKDFLEQMRKTQGEYIFNCQYLNRAVSSDMCTFKALEVKFFEEIPKGLIYFLTLDPAISMKSRADFSGIIVNGVDYDGKWYICEAIQKRCEPSELIVLIFDLVNKYSPMMCVAMEKFALEKFLKHSLFEEMEKRDFYFPLKEVTTNTRISKGTRIRSLQPIFHEGRIFIKKEHTELYHQITTHPNLQHDDLLDALKSQVDIVFPSDMRPDSSLQVVYDKGLTQNEMRVWKDLKNYDKKRKIKRVYGDI